MTDITYKRPFVTASRSIDEQISLDLVKAYVASQGMIATESEDKYARYDLLATPSDRSPEGCFIEVKNRRLNATQFKYYAREGFLIEKEKYDYLRSKQGFYANTFIFDNLTAVIFWDFGNHGYKINSFELKKLPAHTDFVNTQDRSKITSFLPLNSAFIFINGDYSKRISPMALLALLTVNPN